MNVTGESLGQVYYNALAMIMFGNQANWYITVHCDKPVLTDDPRKKLDHRNVDELAGIINVDSQVYNAFCNFVFDRHDSWSEDCSGRGWIHGRVADLFDEDEGYYRESLVRSFGFNQLGSVEQRLSCHDRHGKRIHGGSVNGLVCNVYIPTIDLKKACLGRPRMNNARCLTQIDFKPIRDRLNLMAVFRSQYFDLKAYGNFISLALLLYEMCRKTGYKPGAIVSTANKIVFACPQLKKPLFEHLSKSIREA